MWWPRTPLRSLVPTFREAWLLQFWLTRDWRLLEHCRAETAVGRWGVAPQICSGLATSLAPGRRCGRRSRCVWVRFPRVTRCVRTSPYPGGNVWWLGVDPESGTPTSTREVEESDSGSYAARSYGTVGKYLRAERINSLHTLVPGSGITVFSRADSDAACGT